jgi:ketosteroid isomerase-like protein
MREENVEIVRRIFDAYNRDDYDAAAALAHPDVVMVPPGDQPPYRGRDALRRWMEPDAFLDQTSEIREITAVGDKVLAEAHGRMTGAASGIELDIDFWTVWWFDPAGLITRCEIHLDRGPALEAAGVSR